MKKIIQSILIAVFLFVGFSVQAQPYPNKPIRLIVPFAPGGVTDVSGRIVAIALAKRLNQQVIVENKPGASGNIGAHLVSKAAPDGYTLLLALDGTLVINPHVYERTGFDALNDFAPIAKVGDSIIIIVAHPSVGVKTLAEVVALSKTNGKGLEFGTSGSGSITHVAGELLKQRSGANLVHVPYKGAAPAVQDMIGGRIDVMFDNLSAARTYIDSGRLKALAVSSSRRAEALPTVPTVDETGLVKFSGESWFGVFAPSQTPGTAIERLRSGLASLSRNPDFAARIEHDTGRTMPIPPAEQQAFLRGEIERWARLVARYEVTAD